MAKDAAENYRLTSKTYQKLMLGVALKSSMYILTFVLARPIWNPVFCAMYPTLAAASVIFSSALLIQCLLEQPSSPASDDTSFGHQLVSLMPAWPLENGGSVGKLYFSLGAGFSVAATLCLMVGSGLNSPVSDLLVRTSAPGGTLAAMACFVLQVEAINETGKYHFEERIK